MVFAGSGGGNFSLDRQRKSVLIYADRKTTDIVEALLSRLEDVQAAAAKPGARGAAADVQVRVVWLVNGPAKDEAPPLPDDLKEVLPGLAKMGIDRPRLAAQTLVNVMPNSEFQAKGVAKLDGYCHFSVTGMYGGQPEAALRITIQASREPALPSNAVAPPGQPGRGGFFRQTEEICNLQTVITAPPGHFVVLGMTPSSTPTETLTSVFVVQALRPDGKRP
jgi:hypothetical protein